MFGNQEEDDFGPAPGSSSKLASLFGSESKDGKSANQSLSYAAPKQPKPPAPPSNKTQLLLPTGITAYRIIDSQYQSQGRLNTALLANAAKSDYRILVYQGTDKQIAQAAVHEASQISLSRSQYLCLLDSQNQYWSLLFDSVSAAHGFVRQLCILQYLQQQQPQRLVKFDLTVGAGLEDSGTFDEFDSKVRSPEDRVQPQEEEGEEVVVAVEQPLVVAAAVVEASDEEQVDFQVHGEDREIPTGEGAIPTGEGEIPTDEGEIPIGEAEIQSGEVEIQSEDKEIPSTIEVEVTSCKVEIIAETDEASSDKTVEVAATRDTHMEKEEIHHPDGDKVAQEKQQPTEQEVSLAGDVAEARAPPQHQELPPAPKLRDIFDDSDSDDNGGAVGHPAAATAVGAPKSTDLFGDADSDDDFGKDLFKKKDDEIAEEEKNATAAAATAAKAQQPPPLFSDDEDDDSMNWLK